MSFTIHLPGSAPFDSAQMRIKQTRQTFDHLPAWKCLIVQGPKMGQMFYLCGKCFGKRGNGPATSYEEMWMAGSPGGKVIPNDARCEQCGGRAWPTD